MKKSISSTGHPLGSFVFTDGFVLQEEEEASFDDYDSISEEWKKNTRTTKWPTPSNS